MLTRNSILALWPNLLSAMAEGAFAAGDTIGHGDKNNSDHCAVVAIRKAFSTIPMTGTIEIGEGERDDAPMLYIGEKVGLGNQDGNNPEDYPEISIAIDPLEGTTPCSKGQSGAIAVMGWSEKGGVIGAADGYMDKLIVGPSSKGRVNLSMTPAENLHAIAKPLNRDVSALQVAVLDRGRNQKVIDAIRKEGATVKLINDGDLSEAINAMVAGSQLHAVMGSGGAPEGHISAIVAHCLGGEIQGRYLHPNELEDYPKDRGKLGDDYCERMKLMGLEFNRVYKTEDLAPGKTFGVTFVNVTEGVLGGQKTTKFTDGRSVSWSVMLCGEGKRWLMPNQQLIEMSGSTTAFRT